MPEINIRPATVEDLPYLVNIEHAYQSLYVWQMDRTVEEDQFSVNFRLTRLPRAVKVETSEMNPLSDRENWSRYQAVLTACLDNTPVGYIGFSDQVIPKTVWINDLVVRDDMRRKGIGSALMLSAQEWGIEHHYRKAILETQSKNHPAIQMARKLGYEFCGYNDHYFSNQDIALFFSRALR